MTAGGGEVEPFVRFNEIDLGARAGREGEAGAVEIVGEGVGADQRAGLHGDI